MSPSTAAASTSSSSSPNSTGSRRQNGRSKRRSAAGSSMAAASSKADRPLVRSLVAMVILFVGATLVAYCQLTSQQEEPPLLDAQQVDGEADTRALETRDPIDVIQHTFPIHCTDASDEDQMEEIIHPGFLPSIDERNKKRKKNAAAAEEYNKRWKRKPQQSEKGEAAQNAAVDESTVMKVPKFFADTAQAKRAYGGSIRTFMGNDGERLMTPEEAASIGSNTTVTVQRTIVVGNNETTEEENGGGDGTTTTTTISEQVEMETIYCSVAAYRDPECGPTVEDMYARAKYPDRLRVAIIDQREGDDPICGKPREPCEVDPEQMLCKYAHLIDRYEMDAGLAVGPVFARHLAHRMYRGEYYAMQVDSHVRFTADWDVDMILEWKHAHNEMAVLSTYLSDTKGRIHPITHKVTSKSRPIICNSDYEGGERNKHLRHGTQPEGVAGIHGQPTLEPFWSAGFSFGRGHFVLQVPYDQYLPMIFQGEEISIGVRAFTYGYDFYAPEIGVVYHIYASQHPERMGLHMFWENAGAFGGGNLETKAMKRLNSIIGLKTSPREEWITAEDEHTYGVGKVRRAETFYEVFGIHVDEQRVEHHLCRFVGKNMMRAFMPALRENRMGLDYDKIDYRFVDPAPDEVPKNNRGGHHARIVPAQGRMR